MRFLNVYIYIKQPSFDDRDAKALFDSINVSGAAFVPEKYNYCEPIKEKYDQKSLEAPMEMLRTWGSIFLKRAQPDFLFGIGSGNPSYDRWFFQFEPSYYQIAHDRNNILKFIETICIRFPPIYAIATYGKDHKDKHMTHDINSGVSQGLRGAILAPGEGLPGVYWFTLFGTKLVEFFGEEKLQSLYDIEVKKIKGGCITLKAYDSPVEANATWRRNKENAIIEELGGEYFFDIEYYNKKKRPRRRTPISGVTKK